MADKAYYKSRSGFRTYQKVTVDGVDHWLRSMLSTEKTQQQTRFRDAEGKLKEDDAADKMAAFERAMSLVDGDQGALIFGDSDGHITDADIEICRTFDAKLASAIDAVIIELNYNKPRELAKN